MTFEVTLLVFGILLILVGLVGKVKAKELEIGASSKIVRVVLSIVGIVLVVLSFNPDIARNFFSTPSEKIEESLPDSRQDSETKSFTENAAQYQLDEVKRMHQLNLALLNNMFKEKRESIDRFIKNEYTPKYLEEFKKRIPEGANVVEELPNILQAIMPEINSRRDMMQSAVENQRVKLVTKLQDDFKAYEDAALKLGKLLESSVKRDEEKQKFLSQVRELSNNKIDLNLVENLINDFILDSGDVSQNILKLNEAIDSIIN